MLKVNNGQVLILNQQQCKQLIREEEVPALMEQVLKEFALGEAVNPMKTHVPFYAKYNAYLNAMPCWLKNRNVAGMKWAGQGEENPQKIGMPQSIATLILNDPETALPIAFMDSTYIMALRTGAVAAVMAKYCCKKDTRVMTIIGTGVQGTSAFRMVNITMPNQIEEVRLYDVSEAAMERFIAASKPLYPNIRYVPCTDLQEAVRGSDLIIPAAHAPGSPEEGMLDEIELDKGTTIVVISGGLSMHRVRERTDRSVLDFIKCYVYRINATVEYMREFGVTVEPIDESVADCEIGDIIAGKAQGRLSDDDIVHVAGIGMGIEDIIVADVIYHRALEQDIGLVVDIIN